MHCILIGESEAAFFCCAWVPPPAFLPGRSSEHPGTDASAAASTSAGSQIRISLRGRRAGLLSRKVALRPSPFSVVSPLAHCNDPLNRPVLNRGVLISRLMVHSHCLISRRRSPLGI